MTTFQRPLGNRTRRDQVRRAFTLLELMLALSLTVIVLLIVNMAVDIHLRSLNNRRTQLEEAQLARSILRMIADDLRGTVLHYEQDMSSIEALLQQSAATAVQNAGQSVANAGGASGQSGPSNTSGGSPQSSADSSGLGGQASLGGSSGTPSLEGAQGLAASGLSAAAGLTGTDEPSANTADLSATTIPPVPGLFGNQYQLQIDLSRLPRLENYQQYLTADAATTVMDVPSDVKTVTYYVQSAPLLPVQGSSGNSLDALTGSTSQSSGLVRRELDRSVTEWAQNSGNVTGLYNTGDVLAPEVAAIEFQYFDGIEWLPEWDTELQQKLPIAVLVTVALRAPGAPIATEPVAVDLSADSGLHLYRMLVYLPAGGQSTAAEEHSGGEEVMSSGTAGGASSTSSGTAPGGGP